MAQRYVWIGDSSREECVYRFRAEGCVDNCANVACSGCRWVSPYTLDDVAQLRGLRDRAADCQIYALLRLHEWGALSGATRLCVGPAAQALMKCAPTGGTDFDLVYLCPRDERIADTLAGDLIDTRGYHGQWLIRKRDVGAPGLYWGMTPKGEFELGLREWHALLVAGLWALVPPAGWDPAPNELTQAIPLLVLRGWLQDGCLDYDRWALGTTAGRMRPLPLVVRDEE